MELKEALKLALDKDPERLKNDREGILSEIQANIDASNKRDFRILNRVIVNGYGVKYLEAKYAVGLEQRHQILRNVKSALVDDGLIESSAKQMGDFFIYALDIELTEESGKTEVPEKILIDPPGTITPDEPVGTEGISWECLCHHVNEGKYCTKCGVAQEFAQQMWPNIWQCQCGQENYGNYCVACGQSK